MTPPAADAAGRPAYGRLLRYLPAAILVVGVALRAQWYLLDRAFWRDELMLALGIRDGTWAQLFGPLPYHQKAPVLYLLLEKLLLEVLGPSEKALRLLPFASSVASLLLFADVARRSFGLAGRTVALLGLACSDWAIHYCAEAKPYGVDLFVATLALWIVRRAVEREGEAGAGRLAGLAVAGALGTALSFPGAFVLGAAALALTLARPAAARARPRRAGVALGLGAGTAGVALYVLVYRPMTADPFLLDYFARDLAPPPWPPGRALWYVQAATQFFHAPGGMIRVEAAGPLIALVGLVSAWRSGARVVALHVCFAALLTTLASTLMHYPMTGRLLLFLVPAALWLFGAACDVRTTDPLARTWALAAALFALLPNVLVAATGVARPVVLEDPRPLLARLREEVRQGDVLYLHEFAFPGLHWYAPDLVRPEAGMDVVEVPFGDLAYYDKGVLRERIGPRLAGHPRVWLIDADGRYSHKWFLDELGHAQAGGPEFSSLGFRATLYDTRPGVR